MFEKCRKWLRRPSNGELSPLVPGAASMQSLVATPIEHFPEGPSSCFSRIRSKLSPYVPSRQLGMALCLNMVRDFTWTWLTYGNYNDKFQESSNDNSEMLAQWLYSLAAMGLFAVGAGIILHKTSQRGFTERDVKETIISTAAASAAVITWDEGQTLGINLGLSLGLSNANAGYFSSLFTGGFEGPTQYLVSFLGVLALLPEDRREKYTNNLCKGFVRFMAEFGFSVFPGSIPGGMWQIVYNGNPAGASQKDNSVGNVMRLVGGSAAVAATVGFFNYVHAQLSDKVFSRFSDAWDDRVNRPEWSRPA